MQKFVFVFFMIYLSISLSFGQKPPVNLGDQFWVAYTGTTLIVRGNGLNVYKRAVIKQNTKKYDEEPLSNHEGGKEIHVTIPNSLKSGRYQISLYKKDYVFAGNKEVIIINEDEFIKGNKNGCEGKIENYSVERSLLTGLSYSWSSIGGDFQALINDPQIKITWSKKNPQIQKKIVLIIEQKYIVTKIINDCDKNGNPITSKPQKTAPKRVSRPSAPKISIFNSNEKNITICPESSVFLLADHDKKEKGTIKWYGGKNIKEGDNYSASKAGTYRATITINGRESEKSNPIVVSTVYVPKEIKITNPLNKILSCNTDKIELFGNYYNNIEYIWRKDNQPLKITSNNQIYVSEAGRYTLQGKIKVASLTDGCLTSISDPITIIKETLKSLQFETIQGEKEFCKGEKITLKVQNGTEGIPYEWKYNGYKINENGKSHQTYQIGKFTVTQQVKGCILKASIQTKHFPTTEIALKTIPEHRVDCDKEGETVNIIIDNYDDFNNDAWVWKSKNETTIHSKKTDVEVQHGQYKVVGKDLNECKVEKDITIDLNELIDNPPTITSNTGKYLLECSNDYQLSLNASLSRPSKQSNTYTYKWEKSKDQINWESISNTKNRLQLEGKKEVGFYRVQMINDKTKCKSDFINVPKIEVLKLNSQLKPTIDEYTKQICNEGKATFTINNWDHNYHYFLYNKSGKKIRKLNNKEFSISAGGYRVYCSDGEETDAACNNFQKSMPITVKGLEIKRPTINASKTTICNGESAVLIVENPQEGVTYVWEREGDTKYLEGILIQIKEEGTYWVKAQMGNCQVKSQNGFKIKKNDFPKVRFGKIPTTICNQESATLSVKNHENYEEFQWYFNEQLIKGKRQKTIQVTAAGSYKVKVGKGDCTQFSRTVRLTNNAKPEQPKIEANQGTKYCDQASIDLIANNANSSEKYMWLLNGKLIANNQRKITIKKEGTYQVYSTNGSCQSEMSEPIAIEKYTCSELRNLDPSKANKITFECLQNCNTPISTSNSVPPKIQWHTPYLLEHSNGYEHRSQFLDIKLGVLTPYPVSQKDFTLMMDGKEYEHPKFDEEEIEETTENGKQVFIYKNKVRFPKSGTYTLELHLNDLKSDPLKVNYKVNTLKVLSIGPKNKNLNYTDEDATAFADLFKTQKEWYDKPEIHTLISEKATATGIKSPIEKLKKNISSSDILILFLSSHGTLIEDEFYIKPSNFDADAYESTAVSLKFIFKHLDAINCKKFIFLDACYSGVVGETLVSKNNGTDLANALKELTEQREGYIIFTSSDKNFSYESRIHEHGIFTYAILEGINSRKADTDKNGIIYSKELYDYLKTKVPSISEDEGKGQQVPQYFNSFEDEKDYPIYIYPPK